MKLDLIYFNLNLKSFAKRIFNYTIYEMRKINTFRVNNNTRRNPIDANKHKNVKNFLLY